MLIVDGALAILNGALVLSRKIWCECVTGGKWCGGECHCDDGYCCDCVWHADADPDAPCAEGERFLVWTGGNRECCGCLGPGIFDPDQNGGLVGDEAVRAALCCPVCGEAVLRNEAGECPQRCCEEGLCTCKVPSECFGASLEGECQLGCPSPCCDSDGECAIIDPPGACLPPSTIGAGLDCEDACDGACCVDGELHENSPMTKAECDAVDGCWWGVGSTECKQEEFCREPFDDDCCEHVISSGSSLTFTGPRKKRCPELDSCGFQVTVYVKAKQPVYVHGAQFGNPYETCEEVIVFLLCNDEFTVTPAPSPCDGNFNALDIKVCWQETDVDPNEVLRFKCCDGTYLLGNCVCECVTTLLYEGPGCTSSASLAIGGDCIIDASGSGPLVLLGTISHFGECNRKMTLTGTNTDQNAISVIPDPQAAVLSVEKEGVGVWRLIDENSFSGTFTVKNGAILAAVNASSFGQSGVFGTNGAPTVGDTAANLGGEAVLLAEEGVTIRGVKVAAAGAGSSQKVILGGINTAGTALYATSDPLLLGRDVTLVAKQGGIVNFACAWLDGTGAGPATVDVTIGTPDFLGVVRLTYSGNLETSGSVFIRYGAVRLGPNTTLSAGDGLTIDTNTSLLLTKASNNIDPATVVTAEGGTLTLYSTAHTVSQTIDLLIVENTLTIDGNGALTVGVLSGGGGIVVDGATMNIGPNSMTGTLTVDDGTVNVNQIVSNPGGLVLYAVFTANSLTVVFSGNPTTGSQYVLLAGPTGNSYASVSLTGTTATGTYNRLTSTLTID
jgi:hypothetical protein